MRGSWVPRSSRGARFERRRCGAQPAEARRLRLDVGVREAARPDRLLDPLLPLSAAADRGGRGLLVQQPAGQVHLPLAQLHLEQLALLERGPGDPERDRPLARDRPDRQPRRDRARHDDRACARSLQLPRSRDDEHPDLPAALDAGDRPWRISPDAVPALHVLSVRLLDDPDRPRDVLHQLRRRHGQGAVDRLRSPPRRGRDGPRGERVEDLPEGDAAVDHARDLGRFPALLRDLDRRLRRHLLQCRLGCHVPDLRLGRSAHRRSGAGERDRHGDLRDCDLGSACQRDHPDAPREARLSLPCGEPRLPSWWLEDALDREGNPPRSSALAGNTTAEVAIVVGGYTGLWTALALRERAPDLRVTLLEAEICGHGPSGRNGGFVHGYWGAFASILPVLGEERALELARAGERIIPGIRSWAEARGEDVWLREAGMLEVSAAPAQDSGVEKAAAAAASVGRSDHAVRLTPDDVARRISSPVFRGGVFYPECATVHPGLLVRALRRGALDAGVTLHERTPVTTVRAGSPTELETPSGTLRAPEVVLATNAALTGWSPASRNLTTFGSYVVLTEPAPELLAEIGWTGGEAIVDGRMFLHYFRTTDDGRVLMGSGSGPIGFGGRIDDRFSRDVPTAARAEAGLRRLLPGLAGVRVERAWGGPIDVSADHLPFFRTNPGTRIHYGAGYSGHGVGPAWLGGQILASLTLGRDDEWTRSPPATRHVPRLPPEPLRRAGGGLVRWAIMACEAAEGGGRRPGLVARTGAAVPRLLGMELGTR